MKYAKFITRHIIFITLFYFGFILNVEGARNVFFLLAWIKILVAFTLLLLPEDHKIKIYEDSQITKIPKAITLPFSLFYPLALVWFGAWVTGIFGFLEIWAIYTFVAIAKEAIAKKTPAVENFKF